MCKCYTKEVIGSCLNWHVPKPVFGLAGSHSHDVLSILMQLLVEKCPKLDGSFSKKKKAKKTLSLKISNNPKQNKKAPSWKQHKITGLVEKRNETFSFIGGWQIIWILQLLSVLIKAKGFLLLIAFNRGCFSLGLVGLPTSKVVGYSEPNSTAYPKLKVRCPCVVAHEERKVPLQIK